MTISRVDEFLKISVAVTCDFENSSVKDLHYARCIQTLLCNYKNEKNNFFSQTKEEFKQERYLNLHNFNNRNALTEITLSSHNFAINTTK